MDVIIVRIAKANFQKGLKYAKTFGGKYNPENKTWTIPLYQNGVRNNALNAPQLYGLIPVIEGQTSTDTPKAKCTCSSGQMGGVCTCC